MKNSADDESACRCLVLGRSYKKGAQLLHLVAEVRPSGRQHLVCSTYAQSRHTFASSEAPNSLLTMIPNLFVLLAAVATATATSISASEEQLYASLLKRQAPGTPKYTCHEQCGTPISIAKDGGDVCGSNAFVEAYNYCLSCAGPENFDIWKYYGRSLGAIAEACGFETNPAGAQQSEATSEAAPTPTPKASEAPGQTPVSSPEVPTSSGTSEETASAETTGVSGVPYPGSNATATYTNSLPPQVTTNAAASLQFSIAGVLGAAVVGMMYVY
ncbi:hypothetical protein M011DRAFT_58472 [Sporormia fimetaria CBS 119925]|uniref:Uncharacterized protein n=1 Tax=Sporormia fimetaria CBS 119925 TaxID=1340428 RepID=A0A6A6VCE7_9PLEO|nr:hypothetical protein M011DRAFT_58472 [Sporormia fimetaria CBS 119925]